MKKLISIIFVFLCTACLEPYAPPASKGNLNALVVDGFIDANGSALVVLSRSVPLDALNAPPKESGATVTIESSGGETFILQEGVAGSYSANNLEVDKTSAYALHIVTSDNDYRSDAMKIYTTPAIDSIYYTISAINQLEIRTDSHTVDPNGTGYYLYNAIETYAYHAAINAHFKIVNHVAIERLPEEERYYCYGDERTPNVIVSTKGLQENRLAGVKVSTIDRSSPKISSRYSILLKQRAISDEEFIYQRLLLASTEQQASLFAQIPGTVVSNVHSTKDPDEYVLGYFRGQEVKERRYFIDFFDLPSGFYQRPDSFCQAEQTCYFPGVVALPPGDCVAVNALSEAVGVVSIVRDGANNPLAYIWATAECSDCTIKGGTTKKPSFW